MKILSLTENFYPEGRHSKQYFEMTAGSRIGTWHFPLICDHFSVWIWGGTIISKIGNSVLATKAVSYFQIGFATETDIAQRAMVRFVTRMLFHVNVIGRCGWQRFATNIARMRFRFRFSTAGGCCLVTFNRNFIWFLIFSFVGNTIHPQQWWWLLNIQKTD